MEKRRTHDRRFVPSGGLSLAALLAVIILCSDGPVSAGQASGSIHPVAFYVAPNGRDGNAGTLVAPFLALEKARDAMRASSTMKMSYPRAGRYARAATLILTSADDGETWQYYPPDGVNRTILDGGSHSSQTGVDVILIQGGSNITINGLQIQNFDNYGIGIHGGATFQDQFAATDTVASGNLIINNVIHSGHTWHTRGWAGGGIWFEGQVVNLQVANNVVYDQFGSAIRGCANPDGNTPHDDLTGLAIENNVVYNVVTSVKDNGAIYIEDRAEKKSTNITIKNNFVRDWSGDAAEARAVYLDEGMSNTAVSGNIIGPPGTAMRGTASILMSSGSNNTISGNIFDLGTTGENSLMIHYNMPGSRNPMTNNQIEGNIIIMKFVGPQNAEFLWSPDSHWFSGTPAPGVSYQWGVGAGAARTSAPICRNNVYHNYTAGQERTDGNGFSDEAPIHTDPQISGWAYSVAAGSSIFLAPVNFPGIKGGWGPPGFSIPQAGTPPSSPH